jgi:hypothetical protein
MFSELFNKLINTDSYVSSFKEEKERYENGPYHWRELYEALKPKGNENADE